MGICSEQVPRRELRDHYRPEVSVTIAVHVPVRVLAHITAQQSVSRAYPHRTRMHPELTIRPAGKQLTHERRGAALSPHGRQEPAHMTVKSRQAATVEKMSDGDGDSATKAESRSVPR